MSLDQILELRLDDKAQIRRERRRTLHIQVAQPMILRPRAVSVRLVPAIIDARTGRLFLRELGYSMNVERPAIVLDCSQLREMNAAAIRLLLLCLEGAMKRRGDVRLACASPESCEKLRFVGADRLFRSFDTVEQANGSFQRRAASALHAYSCSRMAAENAA
jgi:anti-anti-sigma factor